MSVERQRKDDKLDVIFQVQNSRLQESIVFSDLDIRTAIGTFPMPGRMTIKSPGHRTTSITHHTYH